MSKYSELKKLLQEQQERSVNARRQASAVGVEIAKLEADLEVAIMDEDHDKAEELKKQIDGKRKEIDGYRSVVGALMKPASELIEAQRRGRVGRLASELIDSHIAQLKELQSQYDEQQQELERLKSEYMQAVGVAGEIYRESERLVREIHHAQQYSPDHKGLGFGGITTGVSRYGAGGMGGGVSGKGIIDHKQIETLFFNGRL